MIKEIYKKILENIKDISEKEIIEKLINIQNNLSEIIININIFMINQDIFNNILIIKL